MKKSFFAEALGEAGKDSRKAWSTINSFIGKQQTNGNSCQTFEDCGTPVTGDQAIADSFCGYYSRVATGLASKLSAHLWVLSGISRAAIRWFGFHVSNRPEGD